MTDIVERLRYKAKRAIDDARTMVRIKCDEAFEAADEIERLRGALEVIAKQCAAPVGPFTVTAEGASRIARATLAQKEGE